MQRVFEGIFATNRNLLWLFAGLLVLYPPLQVPAQSNGTPVIGPSPLQVAGSQSDKVEFEVASVRANENWKYSDPGYSLDSDEIFKPGQESFVADVPLSTLISFAYKLDLQNSMITNLPKWAANQSYEVRARVPGTPTKDQVRLMMQALLRERFRLSLHFEQQEKAALALTQMKPGNLGPWLHAHGEDGCKVSGTPPKPAEKIEGLGWLTCGIYVALDRADGGIFVAARNTTPRQLCAFLTNLGGFGRTVVDRTGIIGEIDFGIEYVKPEAEAARGMASSPGETLVSALSDQLKLKLVPVKALLQVPVVDHVETPTPN
jgi:uncharacterized protein (TIGR03435 family)